MNNNNSISQRTWITLLLIAVVISILVYNHTSGEVAAEAVDEVPGEAAPVVAAALKKLQEADSYAWQSTFEMPRAPKKLQIAPISGKIDGREGSILTGAMDGNPIVIARKGAASAIKLNGVWRKKGELRVPPNSKAPRDELASLLPAVTNLTKTKKGYFQGNLKTEAAVAFMRDISRYRKKNPKISGANGTFRLWLRDGLPTKYEIMVNSKMSVAFLKFDSKVIQTVELKDVGSTTVDVPKPAKIILLENEDR